MADTAQITYEHADGQTMSFFTNNLEVITYRHFLTDDINPAGDIVITDPTVVQRIFTFTALMSSTDWNTLFDWYSTTITYSGAYPRITTVYWDGSTTETNIEVFMPPGYPRGRMVGNNKWSVSIVLKEKTK